MCVRVYVYVRLDINGSNGAKKEIKAKSLFLKLYFQPLKQIDKNYI